MNTQQIGKKGHKMCMNINDITFDEKEIIAVKFNKTIYAQTTVVDVVFRNSVVLRTTISNKDAELERQKVMKFL